MDVADVNFPRQRRTRAAAGSHTAAAADMAGSSGADAADPVVHIVAAPVGVYGWRKRLLYAAVTVLLALAIVNAGLLVYILTTLHVSGSAVGPLNFYVRLGGTGVFSPSSSSK